VVPEWEDVEMAWWKRRRQQVGPVVTGGRLIIGWPGPAGTTLRLARPGDERAVARFVRMTGAAEDQPALDGIRDGSIAATLIQALDQGPQPLVDWVQDAVAAVDDPTHLWPAMTLVLVALDEAGTVVGALLAHPPMNILDLGIRAGIPPQNMLGTAAMLARLRAVAVDPAWRARGIGAALINHCVAIYAHLGYLILYGQIDTIQQLDSYYQQLGFEVLDPGYGFSLADLVGAQYTVGPAPGEQLIFQTRIPLIISAVPPPSR
jgi:GNAT superfamily N-acetyltransferase